MEVNEKRWGHRGEQGLWDRLYLHQSLQDPHENDTAIVDTGC